MTVTNFQVAIISRTIRSHTNKCQLGSQYVTLLEQKFGKSNKT
jgi:hypothetical protein